MKINLNKETHIQINYNDQTLFSIAFTDEGNGFALTVLQHSDDNVGLPQIIGETVYNLEPNIEIESTDSDSEEETPETRSDDYYYNKSWD